MMNHHDNYRSLLDFSLAVKNQRCVAEYRNKDPFWHIPPTFCVYNKNPQKVSVRVLPYIAQTTFDSGDCIYMIERRTLIAKSSPGA